MIEKIAHIRNPLTVIAMFAGIAEVSGTVILPFLDVGTQHVYVWFLIIFPFVLVLSFFGTLLYKHQVLYAPSDFKDENIFIGTFKPATPDMRAEKLEQESLNEPTAAKPERASGTSLMVIKSEPRRDEPALEVGGQTFVQPEIQVNADYAYTSLAEDLVITRLASERQVRFIRNVSPASMPNIVFDAVAKDGNNQIILEVFYRRSSLLPTALLRRVHATFERYFNFLSDDMKRGTSFIIVIVVEKEIVERNPGLINRYNTATSEWNLPVSVLLYSMSELRSEP